ECRDLSALQRLLSLPIPWYLSPERPNPAAGDLSGAGREYGAQPPGGDREHRPDASGRPGAGSGAAARTLGARAGGERPGGAAQWRSGHWQIAPGAGADGPGGRRAPGMADIMPVFAVLPAYRLVSAD